MLTLFQTPGWFSGIDLVFDAIALVIALLIAGYSWKVYKLSSENKFAYFSIAFSFVRIAFISKLITFGVLYYSTFQEVAFQTLQPITQGSVVYGDLFYRFGFFVQMASILGAWLLIFLVSQKSRDRLHKLHEITQIGLFIYLVILISIIGTFKPVIFYLTSAVFLGLISLNYYKNYLNANKNNNAFFVVTAFLLLLIAHIFFVFLFIWNGFYFFGELSLLAGFLLILYVYQKVTKR